ncbi:MAG: ATP-binding cassette domain-containing protein, partial [Sphaerochaetaceae bacterium]|nr:ATP-binding cassette domain-containing protein [Sphaerochaetaceae bacterium]
MTEYGLRCSDILYKNSQFTLKLDFAVKKGELVSIIGPTGCGKSTLLSLISGLIKPESGSIEINGKAVNNLKSEDRHVGLVVQGAALFPNMDVEQNIAYPMKSKKLTKDALKAEIRRLVELVNLTGNEKRRVNELSDSDKQKVALARALASEPELLLLDQVLSSLESQISQNLRTEIRDIQKKTG